MKVRFGFTETPREIIIEMPVDTDMEKFKASVEAAVGSPKVKVLWVEDKTGRTYGISPANLAFVELNPSTEDSRIGFGSA